MGRWILASILLCVAALSQAMSQPVAFNFGSDRGQILLRSAGWLDAERFWFVASAVGAGTLPLGGSACSTPPQSNPPGCTLWGVVDVGEGRLLGLRGHPGLAPTSAALVDGRLFIVGTANTSSLPEAGASPIPPSDRTSYLMLASPLGDMEPGTYLPSDFRPYAVIPFGGDLIIAGLSTCAGCQGTLPSRLLRLDSARTTLRYDRTLPGSWYPGRHVVDPRGRIHFAVSGTELPVSPDSLFPQLPSGLRSGHQGGVVVIDTDNGALVYATYLRTEGAAHLAWDAGRQTVWVLGDTLDRAFPLSADAVDAIFCTGASCASEACFALPGQTCQPPQEAVLLNLQEDGSRLGYATYVGGDASDQARGVFVRRDGGVAVLTVAARIGLHASSNEAGPREFNRIYPERRQSQPVQPQEQARWTRDTELLLRDPDRGDLFTGRQAAGTSSGLPIVDLTPGCSATTPAPGRCFSIAWLPGFGEDRIEPRFVPGPQLLALILLSGLIALGGGARIKAIGNRS